MLKPQEHINPTISKTPEEDILDKSNYTIKQYLGRLLLFTDTNKTLKPVLRKIKDEMYENFCRTKIFKSEDINKIFRLYADKHQDIRISKPQLKLFSKYPITVPDVAETENLRITQYIKTLKFIRKWLRPMMQNIQLLASDAKTHAADQMKKNVGVMYSDYEGESEKATEHEIAKKYFTTWMETDSWRFSQTYDQKRFFLEQDVIVDYIKHNDYQDLMIFALLWFYYFKKPNVVYEAFTPEELQWLTVSFTLPGFHPTSLSLWAFLKIIEHLDFKRLFTV